MIDQSIIENTKFRAGKLVRSSERAARISGDAARQAGVIVADSFRAIANDHTAAAREFFSSLVSGYEKARVDGFTSVLRKPIAYLPNGDHFMAAWRTSMSNLGDAGNGLVGTLKAGVTELEGPYRNKPRVGARATRTRIRLIWIKPKASKPRKAGGAKRVPPSA